MAEASGEITRALQEGNRTNQAVQETRGIRNLMKAIFRKLVY